MLREIKIIIALNMGCALCCGYLLGDSFARDVTKKTELMLPKSTLALAPISLGNPVAATGPATSIQRTPQRLAPAINTSPKVFEKKFSVQQGDTLELVLNRAGIEKKQIHAAIKTFSEVFNARKIRAGQSVSVLHKLSLQNIMSNDANSGTFIGFRYEPSHEKEVRVLRNNSGSFKVTLINRKIKRRLSRSKGIIRSSLYLAGKKVGLRSETLAELIRAFSWDVDFQRDIRKGDKFEVMFNTSLNDRDEIVKSDEILFAALTLQGKRKAIYRLKKEQGEFEYFDEVGHSAQKALMRTPIDGARLSSGFGPRRHPILGYTKMHRGVDFAAPRGTPIYAAGSGIVEMAQRKGGYGKYIRIRHNKSFKTAYAHMSGYARNIRKGARVRQGQTIGYVGSTGRSTGNHLHYEIIKNGKKMNPIRLKMPSGRKLVGMELKLFHKTRLELDAKYLSLPKNGAIEVSSSK